MFNEIHIDAREKSSLFSSFIENRIGSKIFRKNSQISNLIEILPLVPEFIADGWTDGLSKLSACSAGLPTRL
jgi:hypothetical protein